MLGILTGPVEVASHIVVAIAAILSPLGPGLATAAAIVVFTVAVRLLLSPLSYHAIRGQARIAALQPKIAELRTRYGKQPERLQRELNALYQAESGGLLAGCLPLLLQLPFFSVMYELFRSGTVGGRANGLLSRDLLTTPLGAHWLAGPGPVSTQGLLFLGLFVLLAGVGWLTARITRAASGPSAPAAGQPAGYGLLSKVLPYTTVVIAAFVPLAAGLYLLTTSAWTGVERAVLGRRLAARPRPSRPAAPGTAVSGTAVSGNAVSGNAAVPQ
jgi:YidC/Oxa1 family membrane protein insertase